MAQDDLFRREALDHHGASERDGDVLRFDARWTRLAASLVVTACLVGFAFIGLFGVDDYASGPAVVRVDGRRMITATTPSTVEGVDVRPGQWVESGAVLVRMYDADEATELLRTEKDFDVQLARMLRDPNDVAAKESLAALRAKKDQARNLKDSRVIRAPVAGYVSDVRVRTGLHVDPGSVLLAVTAPGEARVSLVAMVPANFRPMLRSGLSMRFELDGFKFEYRDLEVAEVTAEAVGTKEMQRFLGDERADAVTLDAGAKVLVTAMLPSPTFSSEGQRYAYFDGLTGTAEIRVRREPILVMLIPALRQLIPR